MKKKLTAELIQTIRDARAEGYGVDRIAEVLGVSRRSVQRALARSALPADPAPAPPAGPVPLATLRDRVVRLETAIRTARDAALPDSPLSARLTSDLVDTRLVRARVETATASGPFLTYDQIDAGQAAFVDAANQKIAGMKNLECARCGRALAVEPLRRPAPVWRPPHRAVSNAADLAAELAEELDRISATIERILDPSVCARYLRQASRIAIVAARLERFAPREGVAVNEADVEKKRELIRERVAAILDRPLTCARCTREHAVEIAHGSEETAP